MPKFSAETSVYESGPLTQLEISLEFKWENEDGSHEIASALLKEIRDAIYPVLLRMNESYQAPEGEE